MAHTAQTITKTGIKDALSNLPMAVGRKLFGRLGDFLVRLMGEIEQEGGDWDVFGRALQGDQRSRITACARILTAPELPDIIQKTVTIPDKPVNKLIRLINKKCGKRGIETGFLQVEPKKWRKLLKEARGKTFEVVTHDFGHGWGKDEARTWQEKEDLDGNPVALLFWVLQNDPIGFYSTISNGDDELLCLPHDDGRHAPCFDQNESGRWFYLLDVDGEWHGWVLVAFRAI